MNFQELGERLGLDEDEYRELVELFVETGSVDFERLRTSVQNQDTEQIVKSAHTLSGAAGNLGLMEIHKLAKQIENSARDNRLEGLDEVTGQLKIRMDQVSAVVAG